MKKRVLSMLLAFILCFSTLPMTAFAQEVDVVTEQEEQQEVVPVTEQKEAEAAAAPGEETSSDKSTTAGEAPDKSVSDSNAGTQETVVDDEKKAAVQKVQALINALPETVTEDNAESIGEQLAAIDEAMLTLNEEQIAALVMERYEKICAALNAPVLVATQDGEHTNHAICGKVGCTEHERVSWTAISSAKQLLAINGAGNYYLTKNIYLTETWQPAEDVVLCLNGNNIIVSDNVNGITPKGWSTFTLCDCQNSGKITHSDGYLGSGAYVAGRSTFNMYGGSISDNRVLGGAGVSMNNATFNMYGGNITGNKARRTSESSNNIGAGGGVYMTDRSTFNMYDGTITGNQGEDGGGVEIKEYCTFNMYDGTIESNTATGYSSRDYAGSGGGVSILGGTFNMSGGTIKNNTADNGGGVYVGYQGTLNMTDGEITSNKANKAGSGMYVAADSSGSKGYFKVSGSAKVSGNTTSNVYLPDGATMAIGQGGFDNTASIGVTTETSPAQGSYVAIATGADGDYKDGTFIDDKSISDCKFQKVGDQILLVNGTLHQHPICGKACDHDVAHANEAWKGVSSLDEITTSGNYYLTQNIELKRAWTLQSGKVVLCLNGYNIIANADVDVIKILNNTQFILTDCMGGKTEYGKITHAEEKMGRGVYAGSSFYMYGGKISGNTTVDGSGRSSGGGVFVYENCTFTMYGGVITDNKTPAYGGGVYTDGGARFTMTGGSITGNSAYGGGGVGFFDQSSSITVSGKVTITGNTSSDNKTANNVATYNSQNIKVGTAGLDSTAQIGVTTSEIANGSYAVVVEGTDSCKLTETDLRCFSSDTGYTPKLIDNSIVFANGTMHEHPICGNKDCTDGHSNALWLPLTYDSDTQTLKYGSQTAPKEVKQKTNGADTVYYTEYTLPKGNYYLVEDIVMTGGPVTYDEAEVTSKGGVIDIGMSTSAVVNLCLNGRKLSTSTSYAGVINIGKLGELTLSDCQGDGQISSECNAGTGVVVSGSTSRNGVFTMYGGKITNTGMGVDVDGIFKMYGGIVTGNKTGVDVDDGDEMTVGGAAKVTGNTDMNVYLFEYNETSKTIITIDPSLTNAADIVVSVTDSPTAEAPIQIATGATGSVNYTEIFKPNVTGKGYVIIKDEKGDLYLGVHQHNWTYTAEGAVIRIQCDATGCNLDADFAATYTVTAPASADLVYSGSEKPATVTVSEIPTGVTLPEQPDITYQKEVGNGYENLDGVPIDAGTYRASITMDGKTASVTYTINSKKVVNPSIEVAAAGTYDGNEKTPSVIVKDGEKEILSDEYRVSYENNIDAGNNTATVTITDAAGGNYDVSGSATFTIDKATITVTPTAGQTTIYGMSDPVLKYSSVGAENNEDPAFTGALSRDEGKDAGKYDITLGTLALADNSAGNFKVANYELKLVDTTVQFEIVPKILTAEDLKFTTDSPITKIYDGTTECDTATVQIKDRAKAYPNDAVPAVTGTYTYNSANVTEAKEVTFTSAESKNTNYILPADLKLAHAASITKADQALLTITSTSATYGTDLALTVNGGSGDGKVTYTVVNGTGEATIIDGVLHPVKVGEVTVVATRSGGDNYNDVTSSKTIITIKQGDYVGKVSKVVNIVRNRSNVQTGTLTAADFFPEGQKPEGVKISNVSGSFDGTVMENWSLNTDTGEISYTSEVNITSGTDQTCTVTISSTNYNDITATLIFRPTDKVPVEISGLIYTNKIYDSNAIQPAGTLQVTGGDVPVNELEVRYAGTGNTNYDSTEAPKDAGTYKVTYKVAEDNGYYTGQKEYTFTISPKTVTTDMIGTIDAQEYTGSEIKPEPDVKDGGELIPGQDFEFGYQNNIKAGENAATLTITGKGNYTGTASREFTITPKDIKGAVIELEQGSFAYTGLTHAVKINSVTLGVTTLTSEDYEIAEGNEFVSANDAILLTIKGKGNYTGEATTTWQITRIDLAPENFEVTPDLTGALTYDGSPKTVDVRGKDGFIGIGTVTVYYEGIAGTTYARSDKAPTNAGEYKVTVSVAAGTNYNAIKFEAGTLTIHKAAALKLEDIREFYEFTLTGEQTINVANVVAGATGYALGTASGDTGVVSGLSVDQNGIVKFTLNGTGVIGNTVKLPLTITSVNYEDSAVNVIIVISPEYRIVDGADSSWTQNTDGVVVIRGNGEISKFRNVRVDGKVIDAVNYTVTEGSTIITLKADYLKTLSEGSHSFEIVWEDGRAATHFTVASNNSGNNNGGNSSNDDDSDDNSNDDSANNTESTVAAGTGPAQEMDKVPATGDPSGIWLTLFAVSLAGFAGMLVRRKKADHK